MGEKVELSGELHLVNPKDYRFAQTVPKSWWDRFVDWLKSLV